MPEQPRVNPWDDAPSGEMSRFIKTEERDQLILDGTVVELIRIYPMQTRHGAKVYADILIPNVDETVTCSFDGEDKSHPRLALLRHLANFLNANPTERIPVVLIGAGAGYIFGDPRRAGR